MHGGFRRGDGTRKNCRRDRGVRSKTLAARLGARMTLAGNGKGAALGSRRPFLTYPRCGRGWRRAGGAGERGRGGSGRGSVGGGGGALLLAHALAPAQLRRIVLTFF